ncbi:putative phage holin [Streptomyces vinaceus]|uniref:putative phage holin n=1 Tax=Streptomyces vinaceus TaxID=1960 RepID=UPI0036C08E51
MMQLSPDQWVNMVASGVAAAACAGFALVYHLRAPWWRSAVGRNLMLLAGALGGLCLYTVLIIMWPTGCTAALLRALRTAMVLSIAVLMVQRTLMVIRAQRTDTPR